MIKLRKIKVSSLRDAINQFPQSTLTNVESVAALAIHDNVLLGLVPKYMFDKVYLVDDRAGDNYLILGEYCTNSSGQFNKFSYQGKMEYIPKAICTIHNEWELQE